MKAELITQDRFGNIVRVGTVVRVLAIAPFLPDELDPESEERVLSMLNTALPVYEVDQWGRAWVEKWWHEDDSHATSHSLALEPDEMEVCRSS